MSDEATNEREPPTVECPKCHGEGTGRYLGGLCSRCGGEGRVCP